MWTSISSTQYDGWMDGWMDANMCMVVYCRTPEAHPCITSSVWSTERKPASCCDANLTKSRERKSALLKPHHLRFPVRVKRKKYCPPKRCLWTWEGVLRLCCDLLQITVKLRKLPSTTWQFKEGLRFLYFFLYFYLCTLTLAAKNRVQHARLVCMLHAAGRFVNITT